MKKFARVMIIAVMLVLCFTLAACNTKYTSKYSSKLMTTLNTSDKASVSFDSFKGRYVIQLKSKGDEVSITFNATLEEGNIKVYYDYNDEKLDLFDIGADGSIEGQTEAFTSNKTIYIIIESDGECSEGSFSFALKKSNQ